MAVFRIDKTRDYTVMANHHLRNKALSLKAKGLLSLMLSRMQRTGGAVLITTRLTTRTADLVLRMQKMGIQTRFLWVADAARNENLEMLERLRMAGAIAEQINPWSEPAEATVSQNREIFEL